MHITSLEQVDAETVRVTLAVDLPLSAFIKTTGNKRQKRAKSDWTARLRQHLKGLVK